MGSVLNRVPRRPVTVFGLAAALYLVVGVLLTSHGFFLGDALSRLQSAQSVLFSRSPALVDIGFVFTPLTTLCALPLVALDPWIPAMTDRALAGVIVSALFSAGAVLQVWFTGVDRGLRTPYLSTVTVLFAVNPMLLFYAGTGMSEGPFLFAMAWAVRRLMRFIRTDDVHDLMAGGMAVALGFLSRYDGLAAAAAGAVFVFVVTVTRSASSGAAGSAACGSRRHRLGRAVTDTVVFLFPVSVAALVWFATSWLTTGVLSAQVNGSYGNAAILDSSGGASAGLSAVTESLTRILLLAPGLPVLVSLVVVLAVRRRSPDTAAPVLLLGGILAFQVITAASGSTFGLLRFFLVAVLLVTVLALAVPMPRGEVVARRPGRNPRHRGVVTDLAQPVLTPVIAVVLLAAGTVSTTAVMTSREWAPQEYALAADTPMASRMGAADLEDRRAVLRTWSTERRLAQFLDDRDLPAGSVLLDTTFGFPVVLFSDRPETFVVPSDPDFVTTLSSPWKNGVRYILAVPPTGRGARDAVNMRYPTIWDNGAGVGTLDLAVPNDGVGQPDFRLYRVRAEPVSWERPATVSRP